MSLKPTSDLLFYTDRDAKQSVEDPYLIGLFRSVHRKGAASNPIVRWISPASFDGSVAEDATFVASAYVETVITGRARLPTIHICTVGAEEGYGPTLYATILQFARNEAFTGVLPGLNPDEMPSSCTDVWRRFSEDYGAQIAVLPTFDNVHAAPWLNNVFALEADTDLVDLAGMRARYADYLREVKANDWALYDLRDGAYDLAHRASTV